MARKSSKRTIFFPPRHAKLAEIIRIDSPTAARGTARTIKSLFRKAKRRDYKRRLKSAVVLAYNRVRAMLKKKNLSPKEHREMKEVAKIYERLKDSLKI